MNSGRFKFLAIFIAILIGIAYLKMPHQIINESEIMSDIVIYTTNHCPYCVRAKNLLDSKQVKYSEINVQMDPTKRDEMLEKSGGRRTVPQIFIKGEHIGGSDDLYQLERDGKLDEKLGIKT
jgi:glutaredoxin 3